VEKVILEGYIIVADSDIEAVTAALITHIKLTRAEKGCLIFDVQQAEDNVNKFDVYEEFVDEQAFIGHQQRVKTSLWAKVTVNVSRHYNIQGLA
jgi:quinol monooxygenase YgiN